MEEGWEAHPDPPGDEDAEGSLSPVAESNVEGLPNSQLSDFADALEEVGVRAVSTEWHVHLVREAEPQQQFRRDSLAGKCQLCVQCPNGRKHSSLFQVRATFMACGEKG